MKQLGSILQFLYELYQFAVEVGPTCRFSLEVMKIALIVIVASIVSFAISVTVVYVLVALYERVYLPFVRDMIFLSLDLIEQRKKAQIVLYDVNDFMANIKERFADPTFKYLNCGGCGVFAYNLGRFFKKMDVPFRLIFMVKSNGFNHVFVRAGGLYFDSTGFYTAIQLRKAGYYYQKSHTMETLMDDIRNGAWNETYDRLLSPLVRRTVQDCYLSAA